MIEVEDLTARWLLGERCPSSSARPASAPGSIRTGLYARCFLTSGSAPTSAVDSNAAGDPIASVDGGTVGWSITAIVDGAIGWPIVAAAITISRIAVAGVAVGRIAVAITRVAFGTGAITRTRVAVSGAIAIGIGRVAIASKHRLAAIAPPQ